MLVSKAKRIQLALSLVFTLAVAGRASAQCQICDPFLHCIGSRLGSMLCIEGPGSCAMLLQCLSGGSHESDGPGEENLTTWTLFDAGSASGVARASLRSTAGALTLGDDARSSLSAPALRGVLVDAALAHGRDYAIVLVDAAGDGFTLKRGVEGVRVRIEVREVRGNVTGALLASEALSERDQLSVPVRVEGRGRVLVLQAGAVRGGSVVLELARIRRGLLAAGGALPPRQEPLLRARAQ